MFDLSWSGATSFHGKEMQLLSRFEGWNLYEFKQHEAWRVRHMLRRIFINEKWQDVMTLGQSILGSC